MKRNQIINILLIVCILMALLSLCLLFYPTVEGIFQSRVITDSVKAWDQVYEAIQQELPEETVKPAPEQEVYIPDVMPELYLAMKAYNDYIYANMQVNFDGEAAYKESSVDITAYGMEEGPIGKVMIPKIGVEMALYLGATSENLALGLAHMGQTSMPIGGINTNCVISGHRGWRGAAYLRDIHLMEPDDSVFVETLWGTLEYRVIDHIVIEPNEIEKLLIQPGKDLLTIFTCEPYGVGSHRYVLYCERFLPDSGEIIPVPTAAEPSN